MTGEEHVATGPTRVMLVALPLMSWGLSVCSKAITVAGPLSALSPAPPRGAQARADRARTGRVRPRRRGGHRIARASQSQTPARILALTSLRDSVLQDSAGAGRARGVVGKYEAPIVLLRALEKVHAGEMGSRRSATGRIFTELSRHQEGRWRSSRRTSVSALTPGKVDGRGAGVRRGNSRQGGGAAAQHQRAHAAQPPDLDLP